MSFSQIAVIGPGLLGGSVALAARERFAPPVKIALWARREEAVRDLRERDLADRVSGDLAEVVAGADLVVLATPVGAMGGLVARMLEGGFAEGTVLTDVGSVKEPVVSEMDGLLEGETLAFVGSHPMAGSEQTGVEHATASLFDGAACVVTPGKTSGEATGVVRGFWESLGARVVEMEPGVHDRAVASVSHLPHLVASALVHAAIGEAPDIASLAGAGFRDTTRVASGSPAMWMEIAMENREALREPIARMSRQMREVLAFLDEMKHEELLRFLEDAKSLRDRKPEI